MEYFLMVGFFVSFVGVIVDALLIAGLKAQDIKVCLHILRITITLWVIISLTCFILLGTL